MTLPDPETLHPLPGIDRVALLRPLARGRANVEIGAFTYYDDPDDPTAFFERNVLHHYDFIGDRLVIGPFCSLAAGTTFIMNGASHATAGFSAFPFEIFGEAWRAGFDPAMYAEVNRGDTVVGADVWFGHQALVMPGVCIGPGAIIAARAVVTRDVDPYTVVAGNPAEPRRERFDAITVDRLLTLAWWNWSVDKIAEALPALRAGNLDALEAMA